MQSRSLRFRINGAILATCVILTILFGAVLFPYLHSRRQEHFNQIEFLLDTIFENREEELANEIFAGQGLALLQSLKEIRAVRNVTRADVYGLDGHLLYSTHSQPSTSLEPGERQNLFDRGRRIDRVRLQGHAHLVYTAGIEVIGERIGYLKMFFDLADLEREFAWTLLLFFLLLVTTLVVTVVVLNLLLARFVIRPASLLRDALRGVQAGRFGDRIEMQSQDEIGQMAAAFNDMSSRLNEQHEALMESMQAQKDYAARLERTNRDLEELNENLEDIVDDRTQELRQSNEQLMQEITERRQAEEENLRLQEKLTRSQKMEALGLLAGGVAHDLNNVLSGIVSYPDLLLMKISPDSPLRDPIETVRSSGHKAAAIVQDLLTLARRGVSHVEVVNLNTIINDYLNSPEHRQLSAHHTDIELEVALAPDLMNIKGAAVQLKKTLMNLITNAAEAQPAGGSIRVATYNRYVDRPLEGYDDVKEGDYAVLSVCDRGVGIAREDLRRIFEPFYTKKVMGRSGTGLGMAVVWGSVQDHGGYIDIDSREGRGTTFELFFPITRESLTRAQEALPLTAYRGDGQTVLIVDDIREQREIASGLLRHLGYRVAAVASGEEAVAHVRRQPVDILILDMIMEPGMDGLDTYRQIVEFRPGQKAIIASGFAESERVRHAQQLGAGRYLKKPYTLEKLGLALQAELQRADSPP